LPPGMIYCVGLFKEEKLILQAVKTAILVNVCIPSRNYVTSRIRCIMHSIKSWTLCSFFNSERSNFRPRMNDAKEKLIL
jgi:hypothetical protein